MTDLKVGREDIVEAAYEKFVENNLNVTKSFCNMSFNVFIEAIKEQLKLGRSVSIQNFGIFKVSLVNSRKGRNPKTGETIDLPSGRKVAFKASSTLKKAICK